jgi:hypothetical protein
LGNLVIDEKVKQTRSNRFFQDDRNSAKSIVSGCERTSEWIGRPMIAHMAVVAESASAVPFPQLSMD